ncbi:hypothetical protein B0H63DRAFT_456220 [Podospora didyma]|uniref:Uncharacterized protein n=1 Tax=Podospora didyma TaxID=330526 RepID=A0AAE0JY45_9PEZI|nr:hypothetical protein B0H63DRAFT_456220 [Podospora didyma]
MDIDYEEDNYRDEDDDELAEVDIDDADEGIPLDASLDLLQQFNEQEFKCAAEYNDLAEIDDDNEEASFVPFDEDIFDDVNDKEVDLAEAVATPAPEPIPFMLPLPMPGSSRRLCSLPRISRRCLNCKAIAFTILMDPSSSGPGPGPELPGSLIIGCVQSRTRLPRRDGRVLPDCNDGKKIDDLTRLKTRVRQLKARIGNRPPLLPMRIVDVPLKKENEYAHFVLRDGEKGKVIFPSDWIYFKAFRSVDLTDDSGRIPNFVKDISLDEDELILFD